MIIPKEKLIQWKSIATKLKRTKINTIEIDQNILGIKKLSNTGESKFFIALLFEALVEIISDLSLTNELDNSARAMKKLIDK